MTLIVEKCLANGLSVQLLDMSRRIAADRWLVKLVWELSAPLPDDFWRKYQDDGAELLQAFYGKQDGVLRYSVVKERNFIDDQNQEKVLQELVAQFDDTVGDYLNNNDFVARLLTREYEKFKLNYRGHDKIPDIDNREDEGPADFSSCFRDDAAMLSK